MRKMSCHTTTAPKCKVTRLIVGHTKACHVTIMLDGMDLPMRTKKRVNAVQLAYRLEYGLPCFMEMKDLEVANV